MSTIKGAKPADNQPAVNLEEIWAAVDAAMLESEKVVQPSADELAKGAEVAQKTAVFEVFLPNPGMSRKVDSRLIVTDEYMEAAQAKVLSSSKKMLVCPEVKAMSDRIRKFKEDLKLLAIPTRLLRGGMYLVPVTNFEKANDLFDQFKEEFKLLVKPVIVKYEELKEADRLMIGDQLFDVSHYPTIKKLVQKYKVSCRWTGFDSPGALKEFKRNEWKKAGALLRAQMAEACTEAVGNIQAQIAEYVEWMLTQLGTTSDGKRKSINEDKFADMQKFFDAAKTLNITGDAGIEKAIEMVQQALAGTDVREFKKSSSQRARESADAKRAETAQAFEQIKELTGGWIVTKGRHFAREEDI